MDQAQETATDKATARVPGMAWCSARASSKELELELDLVELELELETAAEHSALVDLVHLVLVSQAAELVSELELARELASELELVSEVDLDRSAALEKPATGLDQGAPESRDA